MVPGGRGGEALASGGAFAVYDEQLRRVAFASGRHIAFVEAMRGIYRQTAKERDAADKLAERSRA